MEIIRKIKKVSGILKKQSYQLFLPYARNKKILFIVGCQRSGTTLIQQIFENDLGTNVYGEFSKMSNMDKEHGIRLNPLHIVEKDIFKDKTSFTVLKPLVESQHIVKILNYFDNSRALWVYRNYMDVASSDLKLFGMRNGIDNLRPVVLNTINNWRSENVSDKTRKIITDFFSEEMNPNDAAVLFWFLRNSLFFDLGLEKDSRVMLCNYDYMINFPDDVFKSIYGELKLTFPGKKIYKEINAKSLGKGKNINISPNVKKLADQLMEKLDKFFYIKNPNFQKNLEPQAP